MERLVKIQHPMKWNTIENYICELKQNSSYSSQKKISLIHTKLKQRHREEKKNSLQCLSIPFNLLSFTFIGIFFLEIRSGFSLPISACRFFLSIFCYSSQTKIPCKNNNNTNKKQRSSILIFIIL